VVQALLLLADSVLGEGQMSDYKGAALMLDALPPAKALLGYRRMPEPVSSSASRIARYVRKDITELGPIDQRPA
jgi:hypothetical protein